MKNKLIQFLSILLFALPLFVSAQDFPEKQNPPKLVNDFAGMLSATEVQQLERKLVDFNDSTSTQIAIVIVNSIGDYAASDYAVQLAEKWGIGQKGVNNGILILIAKESRDAYIATGYGMEAYVPDLVANEIIENQIIPNFKNQQYYQGLDEASSAIMNAVKGVYKGTGGGGKSGDGTFKTIFIIAFIIMAVFVMSKRGGGGGGMYYGGSGFSSGRSSGGFSGGSSFGGFGGGSFGGGGSGGKW
ncbi:MAG: TPM domain-containing protein [Bacteroidota bacterium]